MKGLEESKNGLMEQVKRMQVKGNRVKGKTAQPSSPVSEGCQDETVLGLDSVRVNRYLYRLKGF